MSKTIGNVVTTEQIVKNMAQMRLDTTFYAMYLATKMVISPGSVLTLPITASWQMILVILYSE